MQPVGRQNPERRGYQVGSTAVGVVDEGHDVAVVFGGVRRGRSEDRLPGGRNPADSCTSDGTPGQVVFDQGIAECLVGESPATAAWPGCPRR